MIVALVGLALGGPSPLADLFERTVPPAAIYDGELDAPPVELFRVALPGDTLGSGSHTERSRPVVFGDLVLLGSAGGSALYGLSRRDGSLTLSWPAKGPVQSAAVVHGSQVIFSDTAGSTWCYDLDGTLVWSHSGTAPILVSPSVVDGKVYVADVQDLVVALDAESGDLMWRYRRAPDLTRPSNLALYASPSPAVEQGEVLMGFSDGSVVVLDAETGDEQWTVRVGDGTYPDIVGQVVRLGSDLYASGYFGPFVAVDRGTQNVRWRVDAGSAAAVALDLTDEGAVALVHSGTDGQLRSVDARTGEVRWTWDSGSTGALSEVVPTPAGLLVASSSAGIYLVDAADGHEIWRYRGAVRLNGVTPAPVVSGRQVLAVTNGGSLISLVAPRDVPRTDRRPWPSRPR